VLFYLREGKPLEAVLLQGSVEVVMQHVKGDAKMVAKEEPILDVDEVVAVLLIIALQQLKDLDLHLKDKARPQGLRAQGGEEAKKGEEA
jgi:hypothetical protein